MILLLLLFLGGAPLEASPLGHDLITRAKALYLEQEYEEVIQLLQPAVERRHEVGVTLSIEAHELIGLSYLILGEKASARDAFLKLLALDPYHQLQDPSESPKLKRFFEPLKASFLREYLARHPRHLSPLAPTKTKAGRKIALGIRIEKDLHLYQRTTLYWRRAGQPLYTGQIMQGAKTSLYLPPSASDYRLEYYIEGVDREGHLLGRLGTAKEPQGIFVEKVPAKTKPLYRRWWFWMGLGAVVAGGITATLIIFNADEAPPGTLEPAPIPLR
jgi:tetratricopeptide (TPR) repeat protein